jgi:hypothetical protein
MTECNTPADSERDDAGNVYCRRGFLTSVGGITALASVGDARDRTRAGTTGYRDESVATHDHSGADTGGATLRPADLATAETPVVDVRAHGVVGDGETDDTDAFRAAVDHATPRGVLHIPSSVDLRFTGPIDVDLEQSPLDTADPDDVLPGADAPPFALVCEGTLTPGPGLGTAIAIHDGLFPFVRVRIDGGAANVGTDTAVFINDVYGGYFEAFGRGYGGTVMELRQTATIIGMMWSVGTVQTEFCGQALAVGGAGIGELGHVREVGSERLSGFHATDLSINRYEGIAVPGRTVRGVEIAERGDNPLLSVSTWIDSLHVEGVSGIDNVTVRGRNNLSANAISTVGGDTGLVVDGVGWANFDRVYARDNTVGIDCRNTGQPVANVHNRFVLDARRNDEQGLIVRPDARGADYTFHGTVADNGRPAEILTDDETYVLLSKVTMTGNGQDGPGVPSSPELVLLPDNAVHVYDSRIPRIGGGPKIVERIGRETADRDEPDETNWRVGDFVEFTNPVDPSASGVYLLTPGGVWSKINGGSES